LYSQDTKNHFGFKLLLFLIAFLCFTLERFCFSQEFSIVEIVSEAGEHPVGRATLVEKRGEKGVAVTALHVVLNNPAISSSNFKVKDRAGEVLKGAKLMKSDSLLDLALIEIPLTPQMLAVELGEVEDGDTLVFDIHWKSHKPKLSLSQSKFNYYDFSPFSGESGGPVFSKGKLVGVVCGGWFWLEQDVFSTINRRQTWPLRAPKIPKDFVK
jgi:hypothetical protein